jgi:hypothetical protein
MINRTSVALPDGGYLASVEALHNIHCVSYLRKRLYPECACEFIRSFVEEDKNILNVYPRFWK